MSDLRTHTKCAHLSSHTEKEKEKERGRGGGGEREIGRGKERKKRKKGEKEKGRGRRKMERKRMEGRGGRENDLLVSSAIYLKYINKNIYMAQTHKLNLKYKSNLH